ncbi:MAG TPA: hypothetical protein VGO66_03505 [Solirubrobacterales bacterium]|nr:hypothetical protein [Solirubrobacterales bacterium]
MACAIGALTLAGIGCGAVERTNDPRPQVPSRVSVRIGPNSITVQPRAIGVGPDKTQQIPQNQNEAQPPIRTNAEQTVVFVITNQTDSDTQLEIRGPKDAGSGPIVANGPASFQTELPTGAYTISAADIPGADSAPLAIGPYRASAQNDVLLP